MDLNPHAYLVPHPEDCTKFYSCQNLGWKGGYIAHLMDCPPTTGFDTKLRICNYIRALPRCNKGKNIQSVSFNVPCLHDVVLSPKYVRPDLVLTLLVGYLDVMESPVDDG